MRMYRNCASEGIVTSATVRVSWIVIVLTMGCDAPNPDPLNVSLSQRTYDSPHLEIRRPIRELGRIPIEARTELFEITNHSARAIRIKSIEKSCSCVNASIPQKEIPPGETTHLEVLVSPRVPETRSVSLTIHVNDKDIASERAVLSWTAVGAISTDPEVLSFGTIRPQVVQNRRMRIIQDLNQLKTPMDVRLVGHPEELWKFRRLTDERRENEIEELWEIQLKVQSETVETAGRIAINNNESQTLTNVQATWNCRNPVSLAPDRLFLGSDFPSKLVERDLVIASEEGQILEIERLDYGGKDMKLEFAITPMSIRVTRVRVKALLPANDGAYTDTINVICRQPVGYQLELPVSCIVMPTARGKP